MTSCNEIVNINFGYLRIRHTIHVTGRTELDNLEEFLQPDYILEEEFQREGRNRFNRRCYRPCLADEAPRICYYRFTLEDYVTLGAQCGACPRNVTDCFNPQCIPADGYERGMLSVNRMLPGPSIQVITLSRWTFLFQLPPREVRSVIKFLNSQCIAQIEIDRRLCQVYGQADGLQGRQSHRGPEERDAGQIDNHTLARGVPEGTPFMDGVPSITQCSINEGQSFRYDFQVDNEGTHFWHSHDGFQKMDGILGSMVIREPRSTDPNSYLYDYDLASHVMLISDWFHVSADDHFPGLRTHDAGQDPDAFLINGQGRDPKSTETPLAVFRVSHGRKYRFRIIGGTCGVCPVQLTIESHSMTLIATDGNSVKPIRIDSVVLYAGDRFDVVVEASEPLSSYWIHLKGLGPCAAARTYQLGILRYIGDNYNTPLSADPGYEGFPTNGLVLNAADGPCSGHNNSLCITNLVSSRPVESEMLKPFADISLEMRYGFHTFTVQELFQTGTYHRYFQLFPHKCCLKSNPFLQMIFFLVANIPAVLNHPFHLHGHAFRTIATGVFNQTHTLEDLRAALQAGRIPIMSHKPAGKDTLAIPSKGYAVIRFRANNPGFWLFHCHFLYHLATGMSTVIQVGEHKNIPTVPRNFPRCGNFLNPVKLRLKG
ncbi:hypothetical protein ANN_19922 [Periplaneta americana]|uniref:Uncharacterized protein n=1 Tax=Periplaneta americana TaxID=6978 RepID=A0ABQ8SC82_PERAM|nr:hypothetical protein ANN_19922 [Periplaneta americana]